MKWLVKTLDFLLPFATEQESVDEQHKLEAIIARYKNLIPTIEVTMVRTEVFSKCYTYRREVREIVNLLNKVRDQTLSAPQPESLPHVTKMVQEQQFAMSQLDQQRPNIVSMLQRGKDLSSDANAPVFMVAEVTVLERGWKDTYDQSADKLRELKGTQQVWTDYIQKKNEIVHLIGEAETALRSVTPLQTDPQNVSTDLKDKRELRATLNSNAQTLIESLKEISVNLIPLTATTKQPLIEKDVSELQKQFTNTIDHVQNRVDYLEDYSKRWADYKSRLSELQAWANQTAPTLVESLLTSDLTPEEKKEKCISVQRIITDKMRQLDMLANDAIELSPKEGNVGEAKRLKMEVVKLKELFSAVNKDFDNKAQSIQLHFNEWQKYQVELKEIKPQIENFEIKMNVTAPKPISLQEAVLLQQQARVTESECEQHLAKLYNVSQLGTTISEVANVPDELDSINSRYNAIHENAKQSRQKLDKLVMNWQSFDGEATNLEQWVDDGEKILKKRPNLQNAMQIDKLEKELAKLKSLNNDISEHQAKLITLSQSSDNIVSVIAPEGAAVVRERLHDLKARILHMSDEVREKINQAMDQIMNRQDFNAKIVDFSNWISQMQNKCLTTDEITEDKVPYNAQIVHQMLQDSSEKKPVFNEIYNEVKEMVLNTTPEEKNNLNEFYTTLVTNYQDLDAKLEGKRIGLEKWADVLSFVRETENQLSHIQQRLESTDNIQPTKLEEILRELSNLQGSVEEKSKYPATEFSVLQIRDKMGRYYLTYPKIVSDLDNTIDSLRASVVNLLDSSQKQAEQKQSHSALHSKLSTTLFDVRKMLDDLDKKPVNVSNIDSTLDDLLALSELIKNQLPMRDNLHRSANKMMSQNLTESRPIQESIFALDREWENLSQEIARRIENYRILQQGILDYENAKCKFGIELQNAKDMYDKLETAGVDTPDAANGSEAHRKCLDNIRKTKTDLDDQQKKAQKLVKLFEIVQLAEPQGIPVELEQAKEQYQMLNDAMLKRLETTETEGSLWRQIELLKEDILPWISDTIINLKAATENILELENSAIRVNKYNNELPHYVTVRNDIVDKINLLQGIKKKNIPSLNALITEIDEGIVAMDESSKKLMIQAEAFNSQEKELRTTIKLHGEKLNKVRESLLKCDDMSGEPNKIVDRIISCDNHIKELDEFLPVFDELQSRITTLQEKYPSITESVIPRELSNIMKRRENIAQTGKNIQESLGKFLRKYNQDRLQILKRLIETQKEKLQWCNPELGSDKYNLEVKKSALGDVQRSLADIDNKNREFGLSLKLLEGAPYNESISVLVGDHQILTSELEKLKQNCAETEEKLLSNVGAWEAYEKDNERIATSIRTIELAQKEQPNDYETASAEPSVEQIKKYEIKMLEVEDALKALEQQGVTLNELNPDARPLQYFNQTQQKYATLKKQIETHLCKLNEMNQMKHKYDSGIEQVQSWLNDSNVKLSGIIDAKDELTPTEQVGKIRALVKDLVDGSQLINTVAIDGEALCALLPPQNRESIRAHSNDVRDQMKAIFQKAKHELQALEAQVAESTSLDDNINQISVWLSEAKVKNPDMSQLGANLPQKRDYLQKSKIQSQDLALQKQILNQLNDRVKKMPDNKLATKAQALQKDYCNIESANKHQIEMYQKHVEDHEKYDRMFEAVADWFNAIKDAAGDLPIKNGNAETKRILENTLSQEKIGNQLESACEQQLAIILPETDPIGRALLQNTFGDFKKAKKSYFNLLHDNLNQTTSNLNKLGDVLKELDECEKQMKVLENTLKDQTLKNTLPNKELNLANLKKLAGELESKSVVVAKICADLVEYDVEPEVNLKSSRLNTRCVTLKNICKDLLNKYEIYTKDHRDFIDQYNNCNEKLGQSFAKLNQNKDIVGDLGDLQVRQAAIKELIEKRIVDSVEYETVLEKGEKLYPQTSPDGREVVRQQLEALKMSWENYSDDLNDALQRLDNCLMQFEEFSMSQEQLSKWLRDIEKSMQQHMDLKTTIQEKKAQLQNQKLMHQEILSHQPLVENVCERAKQFVIQTSDNSMEGFFHSIKELYTNIVSRSEELSKNLEQAVETHSIFNNLNNQFRMWLNNEVDSLNDLEDDAGEKSDINRKIMVVKELQKNLSIGETLLQGLQKSADAVANTSSPAGKQAVKTEAADMSIKFTEYANKLLETDKKLKSALEKWQGFDEKLEAITKACREKEAIFKGENLQPTLQAKKEKLQDFIKDKEETTELQIDFDSFIDIANKLQSATGTDKVRNLSNQLSNRIQLLQILSKEVVNRWNTIVDDHIKYSNNFDNANTLVEQIESKLMAVDKTALTPDSISRIITDQDYVEKVLDSTHVLSEKIMPDTLANGREQVRQELRELQERWDKIKDIIQETKNTQEMQAAQMHSYQDILQQISTWLDAIERNLQKETAMPYTTMPEIRAKSIKLKTMLQDINSHKRMFELAKDKVDQIVSQKSAPNAEEFVAELEERNERYSYVQTSCGSLLDQLEKAFEAYEQFYTLQKLQQDNQKNLWDSLTQCSDTSGNTNSLQKRLEKLENLTQSLQEGQPALVSLEDHIANNTDIISPRSRENMNRDVATLKSDYDKFKHALAEAKTSLEGKVNQWQLFDINMEQLQEQISDAEIKLKSYCLKNSLGEKQEQLNDYKDLIKNLKSQDLTLEELQEECSKLLQVSGDLRLSLNVQQVISRHQAVQSTAREILKKCEQAVIDHENFNDKYKKGSAWLSNAQSQYEGIVKANGTSSQDDFHVKSAGIQKLLLEQPQANLLSNNVYEAGEKLYSTTAIEGRESVQEQQKDLQNAIDEFFDKLATASRSFQNKLTQWSGFDESAIKLSTDLKDLHAKIGDKIVLRSTFDDKRHQLQHYRDLLSNAMVQKPKLMELKSIVEDLSDDSSDMIILYKAMEADFTKLTGNCNSFIAKYLEFVNDHQQFQINEQNLADYIATNKVNAESLIDILQDKVALKSNLERLKTAKQELHGEDYRVEQVRELSQKVIPGTHDDGQKLVRSEVDAVQQSWEGLQAFIDSGIQSIEAKLLHWDDFDRIRDDCLNWVSALDRKLHSLDLKATKPEKAQQLDDIKEWQGEIRAKELEIDNLIERSQSLVNGVNTGRSPTADILPKYQQLSSKVKEVHGRWQSYVTNHQTYDNKLSDCQEWLKSIQDQITYCSDKSPKDLELKMKTVQDLLLQKEEGFTRIQNVIESAQLVLANTAPAGHDRINKDLSKLQEDWAHAAMKMIEIKQFLDQNISMLSGFNDQLKGITMQLDGMEKTYAELSKYQDDMPEKRAMIERIKNAIDKINTEKMDVDVLRQNTNDTNSGPQSMAGLEALQVLDRFEDCAKRFDKLLTEREDQYRDHRLFKEAFDDLTTWMTRAKDKFPSMKQQMLGDKLAIENCMAPLDGLLNKQPQGELLVEHLLATSEVVIPSTANAGQEVLKKDLSDIKKEFDDFFKDIQMQKDQLQGTVGLWRSFKEEYERLSEWLQQIDILVKNHKLNLLPTLNEKQKQLIDMKSVLERLVNGQADITKFNDASAPLLASHLESYISSQLNHLNSRYQVQLNLGKDVYARVENNCKQHKEFDENFNNAKNWMDGAKEKLRKAGDASIGGAKDQLEKCLADIQKLLQNRDEGQNLVHMTVNAGERILRTTRSDGKETINSQIKEIQSEWDRLVKKMATAKVNLETTLLQWADYSSSYTQLQKWITEREANLQEAGEQKVEKSRKGQPLASGLTERKANLRQTNNIVQDIVSFEPMIQSVTSKASDLQQASPATEITEKYETLTKQAKDLYDKQKETIDNYQALIDAGTDFAHWLRTAKERLSKCMEPTGDQDTLTGKLNQIRVLKAEMEGEGVKKLHKVLEQGEIAANKASPADREIIEEEVALLQEEFDNFKDKVEKSRNKLESAIIQWSDYEKSYTETEKWLNETETLVQSFNKLQTNLEDKRNVLEQFQNHLQSIFDWQSDLDRLNMSAQKLLETCADTRVSNGITQLTTRYNAILSIAKEVMRRLELHYQEHQQHQSLYSECQDWIEDIRHKLDECTNLPKTIDEVKIKLSTVKAIKQMLEQGHNKLRYTIELKEKVIMNTELNGAVKIQEDTENLKAEFDKLSADVVEIKQKLTDRLSELDDVEKLAKNLNECLNEIEPHIVTVDQNLVLNDLSEKRTRLEKYKTYFNELLSYKDTAEKVKAKVTEESPIDKTELKKCLVRYEMCKNSIQNNIESLDSLVQNHDNYNQALLEVQEWIRNTKINVQQNCNVNGERDELLEKQHTLQNIELTLPEGKVLMENAAVLSTLVMSTSGPEGQETIKDDIKQLRSEWEGLQMILKQFSDNLNNCLKSWNTYLAKLDVVNRWLKDFEQRVADMNANPQKWESDLNECKVRNYLQKLSKKI